MSTDLLMAAGVALMLAAIAAGYGICVLVERRRQRKRLASRQLMRRAPGWRA
jgi:hypothetical protein